MTRATYGCCLFAQFSDDLGADRRIRLQQGEIQLLQDCNRWSSCWCDDFSVLVSVSCSGPCARPPLVCSMQLYANMRAQNRRMGRVVLFGHMLQHTASVSVHLWQLSYLNDCVAHRSDQCSLVFPVLLQYICFFVQACCACAEPAGQCRQKCLSPFY